MEAHEQLFQVERWHSELEMSWRDMGFWQPGDIPRGRVPRKWEGLEKRTSERAAGERQVAADVKSVRRAEMYGPQRV